MSLHISICLLAALRQFLDVWMYVAPYFNMTFGGIASVRFFRGRYSWMYVCVSLHISIGLLAQWWWYVSSASVRVVAHGGGVASVVSTVGVLCRKQAVSIRPVPQASQNNSIRSLSLRDLAFLDLQ